MRFRLCHQGILADPGRRNIAYSGLAPIESSERAIFVLQKVGIVLWYNGHTQLVVLRLGLLTYRRPGMESRRSIGRKTGSDEMSAYANIYDAVGGADTIRDIVEKFYPKVQAHPLLAPLFPEDIRPVMEKQYMFLTQFFGGPSLYSDEFGHPMMRARHLPFPITPERAGAWLKCMGAALEETGIPGELRQFMLDRLSGPAYHFVNTERT